MIKKIILIFKLLLYKVLHFDLLGRSAEISYYFIFSLIPFLILIFAIIPIFNINITSFLTILETQIPKEGIESIEILTNYISTETSSALISFSIILSLFSASAVVNALLKNINRIYNYEITRTFFHNRAISMAITMLIIIFAIISFLTYTATSTFFRSMLPTDIINLINSFKFLIMPVYLFLMFCLIYYFGPQTNSIKLQVIPGAIFGVIFYYLFTYFYMYYLSHFSNYSVQYGALTSLIASMSWVYSIVFIVLLGGVINSMFLDYKELSTSKQSYLNIISKYKLNN